MNRYFIPDEIHTEDNKLFKMYYCLIEGTGLICEFKQNTNKTFPVSCLTFDTF